MSPLTEYRMKDIGVVLGIYEWGDWRMRKAQAAPSCTLLP
jgi:hypothetical protein